MTDQRAGFKLLLTLFTSLSIALLSTTASAQDRPLRQWFKERAERRQAESRVSTTASLSTKITKSGDYNFTLQHDGLTRLYRVHVPAAYDAAVPVALLVSLHGGGGNMAYQADDARYGQIAKSEREGYVVVFPNGFSKFKSGKFATWNAGNCCGAARDNHIDDVGFIRKIVERLTQQLNIDRKRIYATGMSNGGMMAYRLACEMSDVFSAIAPVAGSDNTRSCIPKNPVSVLHIHAKNDDHVLFNGGAGPGSRDPASVTDFNSVPNTIAKWVSLNSCGAMPQRVLEKPDAYCETYSGCKGGASVELCVTTTGGHSWPGAEKTRGEPSSKAISANDVMWEFFNRHQ